MTPEEYIDIRTASEMLGLHIGTLYYRIKHNKIPYVQIGITYYLTIQTIEHEKIKQQEKRLRRLLEADKATGPRTDNGNQDPEGIEEGLPATTVIGNSPPNGTEAPRDAEDTPGDNG